MEWKHFAEAFAPDLLLVMTIYAFVVVVIAQLAWYRALATLRPATVSTWSMLTPALGIVFACLLLDERLVAAQWIGGGIIAAGMLLTRFGGRPPEKPAGTLERTLAGA